MTTKTDIQIRFADVDILGHVNNVNLQHYFDLGKSDFFRQILKVDIVRCEFGLITAATNTSYLLQTHMEDKVSVCTELEKIGNKSITLYQRLIGTIDGELRAESRTVLVAFDFVAQNSVEVPQRWRELMA